MQNNIKRKLSRTFVCNFTFKGIHQKMEKKEDINLIFGALIWSGQNDLDHAHVTNN